MFEVSARKTFKTGFLAGLTVDWKCSYPLLKLAEKAARDIVKQTESLTGAKVEFSNVKVRRVLHS